LNTKFLEYILNNRKTAFVLLIGLFAFFLLIALNAEMTYDAGDGIRHYLFSRYSWNHPSLFLDSWAKPFFTFITSPFSQFGLMGITVFNIFCGMLTAWLCYKIVQKLGFKNPVLVIPFLVFTPAYFPTMNSGLTEPVFGLMIIASIYLVIQGNFIAVALLISCLPFVRSEGFLFMPLFALIFLWRKKYLTILLFSFGTVALSIIGYFYYHDLFWIKTQNPYTGHNSDIYGRGSLFHFISNYRALWGTALFALFIAGFVAPIFFKKDKENKNLNYFIPEIIFLVYGCFGVYFIAHSVFWWKGMAGSLGLLRVIAGVMPCSAIICLAGINLLLKPFKDQYEPFKYVVVLALVFLIIRSPFKHEYFPYKADPEQQLIIETGNWYKQQHFENRKVYYLYPYFAHVLNVDSFEKTKVEDLWSLYPTIKEWGINTIPDSTMVIWDAHFGPNECRIPLNQIMNDPNFTLIKSFKPKKPFKVLGGYDFEIYVFVKTNKPRVIMSDLSDKVLNIK